MDFIQTEEHHITLFHIYPKPDSFKPGNQYGTKTNFNQDLKDGIPVVFMVKVEVQQMTDTNALCICHTLSTYELSVSKDELTQHEQWMSLVRRSIRKCNELYKEKVKGTYLDGTDIPLPPDV